MSRISLRSIRTTTPLRQVVRGPRRVLDIYSSIGDYVQMAFNNNEAGDQGRQTCPFEVALERREAQRFGGEASQASRSPLARASGWARKPVLARRVPRPDRKGRGKGPRKPLALPGAPFPSSEGAENGTGQPAPSPNGRRSIGKIPWYITSQHLEAESEPSCFRFVRMRMRIVIRLAGRLSDKRNS